MSHLSTKRPKYGREAERALRFAFAKHLKRSAAHLARADFRIVLDGLVERGSGLMAMRTAAYGRAAFGWAIGQDEIANFNPFSNLKLSVEEQDRDRVLTDGELIEIWEAAGQFGYPFGDWTRKMQIKHLDEPL